VAYDYQNRQVIRTINGTTVYFIYDGWSLLEERDSTGNLLQTYVHGPEIDEILWKQNTTGEVYYHHDGLGSTIALTDETGAVVESYQYDAFGSVSIYDASNSALSASPRENRFLFTGREWIGEIGLYDYRNRVYSPELGRFLQTDPIRFEAGDVNLYRYVANNPINWIDPLGLETVVQIGMGTGITRNPFGHTALATSGRGTHSFGTGTPQGSSFSDYLSKQAGYRDSMVYVLPTTPEQEKAINDYLNGLKDDLPAVPGKDSGDNCSSRTSDALNKAGLDVGSNPTPAQLQRALEKMVKDGNALRFSVPKGSTPSDAWQTFNPR
jgi:RHS repeat-associated protein